MKIIAIDSETFAMDINTGPTPKPVCLSWAGEGEAGLQHFKTAEYKTRGGVVKRHPNTAVERLKKLFSSPDFYIVGQNISYDLGVFVGHHPELTEPILAAIDAGRIYDTMLAEKLINLAQCGVIKDGLVKGIPVKFDYGLDALAKSYGVLPPGYEQMKHGAAAWRVRYGELMDVDLAQWPDAAVDYPILDAEVTLAVYNAQMKRAGTYLAKVMPMRVKAAFALRITGACGIRVDLEQREKIRAESTEVFRAATDALIAEGIVTPTEPPRPYANGAKNPDGTPKMKAEVPEKLNTAALKSHILDLAELDIIDVADIVLTDAALTDADFKKAFENDVLKALRDFPQYVSTAEEFLAECGEKSEILKAFKLRQSVAKIITTELPRVSPEDPNWSGIAWPEYDSLKETGRSSSYASKLFPSLNAQNIGANVRSMFRSHGDDRLLLSADFSSMELVSAAQVCLRLFGKSVLAEVLKSGKDAHAYLGAQICYSKHLEFKLACDAAGASTVEGRYNEFVKLKKTDAKLFKHYRTLAKPTGLGLWGGLGAETFVTYAKTTYGVAIDLDEAKDLIDIWRKTFPEAVAYFENLKENCLDEKHTIRKMVTQRKSNVVVGEDGKKRRVIVEEKKEVTFTKYRYTTANGLMRCNADYCAAANGQALQSPSAEGALMALYEVVKECLLGNFYGAVPFAFVHDEIILDVAGDKETVAAAYKKLDEIMVRNFAVYSAPDVPIKTEPGLMRNWTKAAGPDFYEDGTLMTYEEKQAGLTENPR